jgi:hypothetical protein
MQAKSPSRPSEYKASKDVVFVLGAGVDRVLGLPLLNSLFGDLNEFVRGSGAAVNKAIRDHAKSLRFNLQSYSGDEAESLGQKLLGSHSHLLPKILAALEKHPDAQNANVAAIKTLMNKLSAIADENELDEAIVAQLSRLAGEADTGVGDTLLDTDHITFRPTVRQAIKTLFTQVSGEIPNLTREEQEAFAEVVAILSNFEELMASLFTGYFTKHIPDQKKYFYLAWLLWAYLDRWYECGQTIKRANTIVIIGYSFSVADEHFNDLIRKGNREAKLIVVDPSLDAVVNRVCQTVNQEKATLRSRNIQGLHARAGGRLMFVKAKAEEISSALLMGLLAAAKPEPY